MPLKGPIRGSSQASDHSRKVLLSRFMPATFIATGPQASLFLLTEKKSEDDDQYHLTNNLRFVPTASLRPGAMAGRKKETLNQNKKKIVKPEKNRDLIWIIVPILETRLWSCLLCWRASEPAEAAVAATAAVKVRKPFDISTFEHCLQP